MNYLFEIIQAEILFIFIISTFTNHKISFKFYITLLINSAITISLIECFDINKIVCLILVFEAHLLPSIIGIKNITKNNIINIIYINIFCISFISLINSVVLFAFGSIKGQYLNNRIVEHIVSFIILFSILVLLKIRKINHIIFEINSMSKKIKITILVFIWELFILITSLSALLGLNLLVSIKIAVSLILIFAIFVSFIIVFLLISANLSNSIYIKHNKIMQDKVNGDAKHIEQITFANEKYRRLAHDVKNMIVGINTCLDSNDIDAARKYLDDFYKKVVPSKEWIHTGNPFLDSLLSDKLEKITKNNIKIEYDGLMPTESLKPVDICIVFGNALDNAIEACEKFPKDIQKVISLSIKQFANAILIKITNPIINPVKIHNNNVVSSKSTYGHGIGIPSMRKTVEEYNGQLILKSDKTSFTIEMSFVLEDVKEYAVY